MPPGAELGVCPVSATETEGSHTPQTKRKRGNGKSVELLSQGFLCSNRNQNRHTSYSSARGRSLIFGYFRDRCILPTRSRSIEALQRTRRRPGNQGWRKWTLTESGRCRRFGTCKRRHILSPYSPFVSSDTRLSCVFSGRTLIRETLPEKKC